MVVIVFILVMVAIVTSLDYGFTKWCLPSSAEPQAKQRSAACSGSMITWG